jgi:BASS family bile acid:Na+ symporter
VLPEPQTIVRVLTTCSLGGLLLAVGLRLRWREVSAALGSWRIAAIALLNFLLVPILALTIARAAPLSPERSVGMLLLAAAPFAPVVPVFARMARADLALAAGLTSLFPVVCAVVTPFVLRAGLPWVSSEADIPFRPGFVLGVLLATITLPLAVGIGSNHVWPRLKRRLLRPMELAAEAMGALSLVFVTWVEFQNIIDTPWQSLVAMVVFIEVSFLLGHALGGPMPGRRLVFALGTSNRNIALALLVALDSFAGTGIPGVVVTIGLLLILSGLLHVGYYRYFGFGAAAATSESTGS